MVTDVKTAFLTVRTKPDNVHKAAFITLHAKYEYLCMAFGFCKASQIMQTVIRRTLDGLLQTTHYMDDVGQGARALPEAPETLEKVLDRGKQNGLWINLKKCQLICSEDTFLSYLIGANGQAHDAPLTADIDKFERKGGLKCLFSFLQLSMCYIKFIQHSSTIIHLLRQLP